MCSLKLNLNNVDVFYQSPGCKDELWELLKEILPEFKLSDESSSESKVTEVDAKLKEPGKEVKDSKEVKDGKEVKDSKEVKDGKEYKREGSITTLKSFDKSEKFSKGKPFHITTLLVIGIVYTSECLQSVLNLMVLYYYYHELYCGNN